MFEFEGKEYTLEQIEEAAKLSGMSVNDYISKANIKEKKAEPVEKKADTTANTQYSPDDKFEFEGKQFSYKQVEEASVKSNMSIDDYISKAGINKFDQPVKKSRPSGTGVSVGDVESSDYASKKPNAKDNTDFLSKIQDITAETINMDEGDAVKQFTDNFNKYGFSFKTSGIGDAMIVEAPDGSTHEVDLQPFFESSNKKEADKLSSFLLSKGNVVDKKTKEFIEAEPDPALKEIYYEIDGAKEMAKSMKQRWYNEADEIEEVKVGTKKISGASGGWGMDNEIDVYDKKPKWERFRDQATEVAKKMGDSSEENIADLAKKMYADDARRSYVSNVEKSLLAEYEANNGPGFLDNLMSFAANGVHRDGRRVMPEGWKPETTKKYEQNIAKLREYFKKDKSDAVKEVDRVTVDLERNQNNLNSKIKEYESLIESNKKTPSEENVDKLKDLYIEIKGIENESKDLIEVYSDKFSEVEDYHEMAMAADVNYNSYDYIGTTMQASVIDTVSGLGGFVAEYNALSLLSDLGKEYKGGKVEASDLNMLPDWAKATFLAFSDDGFIRSEARDWQDEVSKITEDMRLSVRETKDVSSIDDLGSFFDFGMDLAVGNAVTLATTVALPEVGIFLLGAATAGNKRAEIRREEEEFGIEYNIWQKLATPIMYGAAEAFSEKIKLDKFTKGMRKFASNVSKRLPDGDDLWDLADINIPNFSKALKEAGIDLSEEGLTEVVSQIGQNFADRVILGKENVGLFDNVDEAFISGAVLGAMFQTPALATEATIHLKTKSETIRRWKEYKGLGEAVNEAREILSNPEKTPEQKARLEELGKKINSHTENLLAMRQEQVDAYRVLTKEQRTQFSFLTKRASELEAIKWSNNKLTEEQQREYNEVQKGRVDLLRQGKQKLFENGVNAAFGFGESSGSVVEVVENDEQLDQMLRDHGVHGEMTEDGQFKYADGFYSEEGVFKGGTEGVAFISKKTNQPVIIYNKQYMFNSEGARFSVIGHEITHQVANKMFGGVNSEKRGYREQWDMFLEATKTLNSAEKEKLLNYVIAKIVDGEYAAEGADFRGVKSFSDLMDRISARDAVTIRGEAISFLSEAISNNIIDFNSIGTITERIGSALQSTLDLFSKKKFGKNVNVQASNIPKTGKELISFLREVDRQIKAGKFDSSFVEDIFSEEKSNSSKELESMQASMSSKVQDLSDKLYAGEITIEQYEDAIDSLNKDKDKYFESKTKKANRKDFKQILDNAGSLNNFNPETTPFEVMSTIEDMIRLKAKSFRTQSGDVVNLESLPGFSIDDFVSEVFTDMMTGRKMKDGNMTRGYLQLFNPAINDSFYGYVNAQIGNRMINVLKKGEMTQQNYTSDITERVDIAAEETSFDEEIILDGSPGRNLSDFVYAKSPKLIHPKSSIPKEYSESADTELSKNISEYNLDGLIFKNTPNLVTGTLAKMFSVREEAVRMASKALNTSELINSAPVMAEIADTILSIMPNGAILESNQTEAVAESLIGTGTGLPSTILNTFYNKKERLVSSQEGKGVKGHGLEVFELKPGLTKEEFLDGLGILPDGTHDPSVKPRASKKGEISKAQTRRAMIDLFGKLITNTEIRLEMERRGMSVMAINNLAAGKSTLQAARVNKNLRLEAAADIFKKESDPVIRKALIDDFVNVFGEEALESMTEDEIQDKAMEFMEYSSKNGRIDSFIDNINDKDIPDGVTRENLKNKRNEYKGTDYYDRKRGKNVFKQKASVVKEKQEHGKNMLSMLPKVFVHFIEKSKKISTESLSPSSIRDQLMGFAGLTKDNAMVFNSNEQKAKYEGGREENVLLNEDGSVADGNTFNEVTTDKNTAFSEAENKMSPYENIDSSNADQVRESIRNDNSKSDELKRRLIRVVDLIEKNGGLPPTYKEVAARITKVLSSDMSPLEKGKAIIEALKWGRGENGINNSIRRAMRDVAIQMHRDYVFEAGIDSKERTARLAYSLQSLRSTESGFKLTASISSRLSLITTALTKIQFEHIIPASLYDMMIARSILTGKKPPEYQAGFFSKEVSAEIDKTRISAINSIGKIFNIKLKTGFSNNIRRNQVGKRLTFSYASSVPGAITVQASRVDGEPRTIEQEQQMMETMMGGILKDATGIPVNEQMSQSTARLNADVRKKKFRWMSPTADDFTGLLYSFLGKGKVGEAQWAFFQKALIDPLNDAYVKLTHARQEVTNNFREVNKKYKDAKKSLSKKIGYKNYTNDHAVRFYLYKKNGESNSVLGLTEADEKALIYALDSNPELLAYAEELSNIAGEGAPWASPKSQWTFGSVHEDVERVIDDVKRAEFFAEWKANADAIFSPNNLNKIESHYGTPYRNALEDMLYRIEKGKAIPEKTTREMSALQKWLTGSVAVTMFFNRRSAILQLTSFTNYLNWTDNNPFMFGKALANPVQFGKDLARIFNSDYLKERRGGLKTEVEAAVLANELRKGGVDGFRGLVNKLLQYGFTLTQIGDSLAISVGGASFYRNRKNTYLSKGLTEKEAHDKAWLDFIETTEESQQSARPDKLSQQQTTTTGRLFLAFQNTPMQYYRIVNKSAQDLIAGRGNPKQHISKIVYYTGVQAAIFNALQQSLFAFLGDGDEEDEDFTSEKQVRTIRAINSALDTMLKGSGIQGVYIAGIKNTLLEFNNQEQKGFKADHARTIIEGFNMSAPIGIKLRTLYQGGYMNYKYNKEIMEEMGVDIDNPAYDVAGSLLSFGLNVPADKVINTIRGLKEAADSEHENWQRVALALGWSTWNLGIENKKIKDLKAKKTEEKKAAAKDKRNKKKTDKQKEQERIDKKLARISNL